MLDADLPLIDLFGLSPKGKALFDLTVGSLVPQIETHDQSELEFQLPSSGL